VEEEEADDGEEVEVVLLLLSCPENGPREWLDIHSMVEFIISGMVLPINDSTR
jgi:hypothetical protein